VSDGGNYLEQDSRESLDMIQRTLGLTVQKRQLVGVILMILVIALLILAWVEPQFGSSPGRNEGNDAGRSDSNPSERDSEQERLPSVGIGALIGAVGGASVAHIFALRREQNERVRETKGLLRLLLAEFKINNRSTELLLHKPEFITYSPDETFQDEVWKESRTRLAQLPFKSEHFDLFTAYYYNNSSTAREMSKRLIAREQHIGFERNNPLLGDIIEQLREQQEIGQMAEAVISKYVSSELIHAETLEEIQRDMEGRRPQDSS